jgi:hypothetical protein
LVRFSFFAINFVTNISSSDPQKWDVNADIAAAYYRRLGNMVLLNAEDNVKIGNKGLDEKRRVYKDSP